MGTIRPFITAGKSVHPQHLHRAILRDVHEEESMMLWLSMTWLGIFIVFGAGVIAGGVFILWTEGRM